MSTKTNRASMLHAIAEDLGVAPELVGVVGKGLRSEKSIREAMAAHLSREAQPVEEPVSDETPRPAKPRKPGLTLSQRRALLRLLDDAQTPASPFKALPYEHLVECGYAVRDDAGTYTLTDEGVERATAVNPGYRVWASGETVVLDADGNPVVRDENGEPIRPAAGTARAQAAAKAAQEPVEETAVATA